MYWDLAYTHTLRLLVSPLPCLLCLLPCTDTLHCQTTESHSQLAGKCRICRCQWSWCLCVPAHPELEENSWSTSLSEWAQWSLLDSKEALQNLRLQPLSLYQRGPLGRWSQPMIEPEPLLVSHLLATISFWYLLIVMKLIRKAIFLLLYFSLRMGFHA